MAAKPKPKAPRADFALPPTAGKLGAYPLNTAGRRQVADKDAAVARRAGTITPAQEATVKRKVAEARGNAPSNPAGKPKRCANCGRVTTAATCPGCGKRM